jgi:hypothetical protein
MTWLLWRQHRAGGLVLVVILAVFAIAAGITGVHMANLYDSASASCAAGALGCNDVFDRLFSGYGAIIDSVHLTIALPVVLGAFLGATLIARETEHSTDVVVWTQGVTRRRWTLTKVGFALLATIAVASVTSVLVTWWSGTPNAINGNRFQGAEFDTQNIVPVAHALFAVGLGLAAGALLRRSLAAVATTVGVYVAVRIVVTVFLRPHYAAPTVLTTAIDPQQSAIPPGSWTLSQSIVGSTGNVVTGPIEVPRSCAEAGRDAADRCLADSGYHGLVRFHPPSSYWRFQWTESLLYVAVAAVLTSIAVVATLRRDA